MSATRRGRARTNREEGRAQRENAAADLDRLRRAPEGRYTVGDTEYLVMPGDEYVVRDSQGHVVFSHRGMDYLELPTVRADALVSAPEPLRKAVSRRTVKRKT